MPVEHLMTTPVITISSSAWIVEAALLMLKLRVSGLPVVDENERLVGILSESDFLRRSELHTEGPQQPWWRQLFGKRGKAAQDYIRAHGRAVEEVMSRKVVTICRDASLSEAVELM